MKKYALPAHIAFSQALNDKSNTTIEFNLSNSCAQSMTVSQLCQLAGTKLSGSINEIELSYSALQGSVAIRQAIVNYHQYLNYRCPCTR